MKNIFNTLSIVVCFLGLSLNAQTNKTSNNSLSDPSQNPVDSKASFINNQDYLSASTLKDYKNYYGDSLKGFDEMKIRVDLLARHFYGSEYLAVMNFKKREFINNKYKIGPQPVAMPAPPILPAQPKGNVGGKLIGGGNTINMAPCVNEDFESTLPGTYTSSNAVIGWTVQNITTLGNQLACGSPSNPAYLPGSPEFSIVATPVLSNSILPNFNIDYVTIPNSPLGGNNVARLNNSVPGFTLTRISTTFPVTTANTLFQFAYAGSWDGSGHYCCDQPFFTVNMFDCTGAPLGCSSISLTPPGSLCQNGATGYSTTSNISWTNWQVKYIDLTPYIGSCVTLVVTNADCDGGAHHGTLYFDAKCGGSLLCTNCGIPTGSTTTIPGPVSFCAGSGQAQVVAPTGYATYSWVAPPGSPNIPAAQATLQTLTISNPVPGSVYTVNLVTPSGCLFVSTNTIVFTSVNIAGIGSAPSCAGGASGTATVVGNGSGTGYNYSWINTTTSSVVSTASVATGLAAGVYSVVISGFGSAGCGSAVATTTVTNAPPGVINILKPYCGTVAYLNSGGGSNFQWYNGTSAITASLGGNSSSITVNSPSNGSVVTLTFHDVYGCQDSVRFTLAATAPGFVTANNISWICPGGNNGTAMLNMSVAQGAPPGYCSYSVVSTSTTNPYNVAAGPGPATSLSLTGLSAGSYNVNAFDGSCAYTASFVVSAFVFNYTVSPVSPTLCPGNSIQASLIFASPPSLGQYTYSWSPTTFLAGNLGTAISTIITPTTAIGTQTTINYIVVATPSAVNCPITKTITINVVNPPIPIITAIPNLCNTFAPYQIATSPAGGSFNTGITGTNNPISSSGGIITPSLAVNGINTFTYSIAVNTCVATNTATYQVSKFWTSALSSSVPALCVTNAPFNLMNIVQNTSNGSWGGPGVQTNQFIPANLLTNTYQIAYTTSSTPNPTVCPSTTSLNVSVTKTITPLITQVPEFCTNAAPINMTVSPTGGGWLPAAGLSNSGVITPPNITVSSLTVIYTVSIGPCLNTSNTTLHISHFYPAGFSGTVNPLCFNSNPVNLMSIVQATTNGSWANSSASGVQTNSFFPGNLSTGVYTATYNTSSSPNPTLCADSRTIAISVLSPPTPTITQIGPLCNNGAPMLLAVAPNTGHWTGSPYLTANGLFTPSLTSVGNNPVQYVIGTNTCNVQQTRFISIEAFVPATIIGQIPDLCNTSPVLNLSPLTISGQGTWRGNGILGASFNPGTTGSGSFVLSYHTASFPSGLCPDNASISVNVYSLALPAITGEGPFCNSSLPVQLQVSPVGGLFGGPSEGVITLAGKFNPASALIGDNIINYSITSGPCVAYAQTIIKVEQFISADFAKYAGPFCKTDPAVNMNSFVQNPGGDWSGSGMVGTMFTPSRANIGNTNIVLYTTHSVPTASLCPDTSYARIEVRDIPVVTAITNTNEGCVPLEVIFNTPNINSGEGIWSIDDGSQPLSGLTVSHIFTAPGNYNVQFNYTDGIGCKAAPVKTSLVSVYDLPKVNFSLPNEIYISDPQIQIINLTSVLNDNIYLWQIGTLSQSSDLSPVVTFPKIGKYQVTLTATSLHGCTDNLTKTIEVKNNFSIFIPNSFTPNFDGLNDYFVPVYTKEGIDLKSFDMEIFDRWGHSLYHTKDITKGWDGSVQNKGEPLQEGVYIYKIRYKDMDGNAYEKMGEISLLK
jgi:gliding motility-associated-like protein